MHVGDLSSWKLKQPVEVGNEAFIESLHQAVQVPLVQTVQTRQVARVQLLSKQTTRYKIY